MNKNFLSLRILFIAGFFNFITASAQQSNMLTEKEKQEGWHLLFNGKDLQGWHSYLQDKPAKGWQVENGTIFLNKNDQSPYEDYIDIVTDKEFENFDLKVEFKMDTCANSGIMFYVHESPEYKDTWVTGPEMQIDDLVCGPDHEHKMNRAGTLYDLIAVDSEWLKPSGTWNEYEIKADKGHLQLFQNGHKVIDTHLWDDHWKELIANSKFKDMPNFGTFRKGHIAFQGTENGKLWFRNIKIKEL
ncbi:MAG TPA: DUF1080 domain-containing protein [Chitinophagaceae bacterium]|jgi:hypothetical protein